MMIDINSLIQASDKLARAKVKSFNFRTSEFLANLDCSVFGQEFLEQKTNVLISDERFLSKKPFPKLNNVKMI